PLARRAWAFQERFLAPRTIHFTADRILCECEEQVVCELWPEGIPEELYPSKSRFPKGACSTEWSRALQIYSRAHLTYSKDKLVAISGVARHFQKQNHDQYIAGLWRKNFVRQMCWAVDMKIDEEIKPCVDAKTNLYQGPSWSWASADRPITWEVYA
ncbi:hypothetical protein AOQ84DRAFT_274366, partial [Glonium stellatum]